MSLSPLTPNGEDTFSGSYVHFIHTNLCLYQCLLTQVMVLLDLPLLLLKRTAWKVYIVSNYYLDMATIIPYISCNSSGTSNCAGKNCVKDLKLPQFQQIL